MLLPSDVRSAKRLEQASSIVRARPYWQPMLRIIAKYKKVKLQISLLNQHCFPLHHKVVVLFLIAHFRPYLDTTVGWCFRRRRRLANDTRSFLSSQLLPHQLPVSVRTRWSSTGGTPRWRLLRSRPCERLFSPWLHETPLPVHESQFWSGLWRSSRPTGNT